MPNLKIPSIELISTQRRAPLNGAPSSADYNDSMREILTDLAVITELFNGPVLKLFNSLPLKDPQILEGGGIYASTADSSNPLFYDTAAQQPLTIADVLTRLNQTIAAVMSQITDLTARVLSLQSRLATTQQNDVAKAIQGFANQLNAVTSRVAALEQPRNIIQ